MSDILLKFIYDAVCAFLENDDVPNNDPVNADKFKLLYDVLVSFAVAVSPVLMPEKFEKLAEILMSAILYY